LEFITVEKLGGKKSPGFYLAGRKVELFTENKGILGRLPKLPLRDPIVFSITKD